VITEKGCEGN